MPRKARRKPTKHTAGRFRRGSLADSRAEALGQVPRRAFPAASGICPSHRRSSPRSRAPRFTMRFGRPRNSGSLRWASCFGSSRFSGCHGRCGSTFLAHELTHAVWVMLMGGRVHKFHVTRDGGHNSCRSHEHDDRARAVFLSDLQPARHRALRRARFLLRHGAFSTACSMPRSASPGDSTCASRSG